MKKNCFKLLAFAIALSIAFVSCKEVDEAVSVTGVLLNGTSVELKVGDTETLSAVVAPENATDKTVKWESDNKAVATVADGVVTAVAEGTAIITVTTTDGSKTDTCTITVVGEGEEPIAVISVTLSETELEMEIGDTKTIQATIVPENADNKNITWTSEPEAVATVVGGVVTAVAEGTATITVTTEDGSHIATCTVTVLPEPDIYIAGMSGSAVLWVNGEEQALEEGTQANSVAVSGGDVYVAGINFNMSVFANNAILWKNGVPQTLNTGNSQARGVVVSGNDVYVVGQSYNTDNYVNNAVIWKNGVLESVSIENSQGWGLFVSGSDVYVVGTILNASYQNVGALWKNGEVQTIENGGLYVYGCYVSGSDVYATGSMPFRGGDYDGNSRAALWKNGAVQTLEEVDEAEDWVESGQGNAVLISGSDVYVAGKQMYYNTLTKKATLWKNGEAQMLSNTISEARSVCVHRGNVYVAGDAQNADGTNVATLWKNGTIIWQSDSAATSSAMSVVVL